MGIHGLTTYLRENKRHLCQSVDARSSSQKVNVVVDGLSFVYQLLYHSSLPWVYGGEYPELARLTTHIVKKWQSIGFNVVFAFDGPSPRSKFTTITSRLTKGRVQPSLLFFRTSPVTRSTSRFLSNPKILPPFIYEAVLQALQQLADVDVYFADGECDPFAVELAGRIGAYVIGNDSDFVVLNSEGYKGFIPMDDMTWILHNVAPRSAEPDESQEWVSSKPKKQTSRSSSSGKGIVPPDVPLSVLTLSYIYYTPTKLANYLRIPISILPILGALIGNDFTNQSASKSRNYHSLFFERQLTLSGRIEKVAAVMRAILDNTSEPKRKHKQVEGVLDLIDRSVKTLVAGSPLILASGELDAIVDKVVDSTLQYALPKAKEDTTLWPTSVCALHTPDECPMAATLAQNASQMESSGDDQLHLHSHSVALQYLSAYRQGLLSPLVMDCITTATHWPRIFLENPDLETIGRLARSIRQIGYAILDDAVGLPEIEETNPTEPPESTVNSDEELVDVVEDDSEEDDDEGEDEGYMRPLQDHLNATDLNSATHSVQSQARKPRVIMEYIRRGTRVADEAVSVPALAIDMDGSDDTTDSGIISQPSDKRLDTLLQLLQADLSSMRTIPPFELVPVLTLRHVVRYFHARALESPSKQREMERWTVTEARCFLASFVDEDHADSDPSSPTNPPEDAVPIEDRNVQLTAQVLQALEAVQHLVQIMLLTKEVPLSGTRFSGKRFHALLTRTVSLPNVADSTWRACVDGGLEAALREDRRKVKQSKKKEPQPKAHKTPTRQKGVFDMLGDAEA